MDLELQARFRIVKASGIVKEKDKRVIRKIRMELEAELDTIIARALGDDAMVALEGLKGGGMNKVELPIDAVVASALLKGDMANGQVKIAEITGIKAVAKRTGISTADDDGDEDQGVAANDTSADDGAKDSMATIRLLFQCAYSDELWLFLGRNLCSWADVTLKKAQLALPKTGATVSTLKSVG